MAELVWRKATKSNPSGNCVEVAFDGDAILVRDSKHPGGPVLCFSQGEWDAFLDGVEKKEFVRVA